MADNLLRLKVDSQEYDAKIKRAAEGIQHFVENVRESGSTLKESGILARSFLMELGNMETVAKGGKQQLREMSNALVTLTTTYRGLSDAEKQSGFGQELAKQIQILTERAGKAKDAMTDVAMSIKNASSDTRAFDQISQGASVLTAGFQGLIGAGKMLGIEMGNDVEVIAKLQAAMAVTNSLTTIQTALQKESALMQGIQAVKTAAASAAQRVFAAATGDATKAQAAFNAVSKANPYLLLASAVVAVGGALFAFSNNAKKAKDATEEQTEAMKQAQHMSDIWKSSMGSTYSSLMTKYDELKRQWQSLRTEHEKLDWIKNNKNALHSLSGEVNNVKTAEEYFNNNTDAVVQSFVRRAQAAARVAQLTELYRKQIELLDKKSQVSADITADAEKSGRRAKAGDIIKDSTFRSSKYGKVNAQGQWVFTESGAQLYSGTNTSSSSAVMAIDVQLNANQAEIEKVKSQITNEFQGVVGSNSKGSKEDKDDFEEIIGLINNAKEAVADLQKRMSESWDDEEIAKLGNELRVAEAELERLKNLAKGPELDKLFPDNSAQNYNTGYAGSAQSRYTSAIADFAQSPLNTSTVSSLVSDLQSALSEADFGTPIYNSISEKLKDATTMSTLLQELMERGVEGADLESVAEQMKAALLDGDIPDEKVKDFISKLNEQIKEQGGIELDYNASTGEVSDKKQGKAEDAMKKFSAEAGKFVGGLGEVANGLRAAGISIPNDVNELLSGINGFMKIISGFQSLISLVSTPAQIANTTAIANLTAILAARMFVPGLQNGGIIPHAANGYFVGGTHMSGDVTPIMANEGELVLNKSQQFNLAAALSSNDVGQGYPEVRFSGEDLFVVLNNYLQRAGYGEILTSKG